MTVVEAVNLLNEPDFLKQIEYHLVKAAIAVSSEADGARKTLAKNILANSGHYVPKFAMGVLTQTEAAKMSKVEQTGLSDITDDTLFNTISAIFDAYA